MRGGGIQIRSLILVTFLLAIVALVIPAGGGVGGAEVLINGGFESGVSAWEASNGTLDAVGSPVHSGLGAARLAGDGTQVQHEVYQWVAVNPGADYELTAWVLHDDPNVSSVFLRVVWANENLTPVSTSDSLAPLTFRDPAFRPLSTGPLQAPAAARYARIGLRVQPAFGAPFEFAIYADDFSFTGPDPTPTPDPTLPPTAIPTPVATPSPSAAPTQTAGSTPTASPLRTPAPTPRRTPTPRPEETVFPVLTNGGFETLRGDGSPFAWRKFGGEIGVTNARRHEGSYSLVFSSQTASTKWVYQNVHVQGGAYYRATAMALKADSNIESVFLRISWYETDDATGESIDSSDSLIRLEDDSNAFELLDTGPIRAPEEARTARVRLMLRPGGAAPAYALFDAVTFTPIAPPSPTPSATIPPKATPTATPGASDTPAPETPVPTSAQTPVPTLGEPSAFAELTNGSFEQVRDDGTPFAWRKYGGQFAAADDVSHDGSLSLQMVSDTSATKWVHQAVVVSAGAFYEASAWGQKYDANIESLFIRVSWYASPDGGGDSLDSVDSNEVHDEDPGFVHLSTGPVQAPVGAQSARIKLMLRPAGDAPGTAYFDSVTFGQTQSPTAPPPADTTPAPAVSAAPVADDAETEPLAFPALTNGDFETVRADGTPYGWRNVGGVLASGEVATSGSRSLVIASTTGSTKWAYQTVAVSPGAYYAGSVDVWAIDGVAAAFLRISWYGSTDGSGEAVEQADSEIVEPGAGFRRVSTGPVLAPPAVHSARVRLMLRPQPDQAASAAYDLASFVNVPAPVAGSSATSSSATDATPAAAALGAASTPKLPVNQRAGGVAEGGADDRQDSGGMARDYDWVIALAVGVPIGAAIAAGALGIRNRRQP